jgi:hypothetical protein
VTTLGDAVGDVGVRPVRQAADLGSNGMEVDREDVVPHAHDDRGQKDNERRSSEHEAL